MNPKAYDGRGNHLIPKVMSSDKSNRVSTVTLVLLTLVVVALAVVIIIMIVSNSRTNNSPDLFVTIPLFLAISFCFGFLTKVLQSAWKNRR
jgi:uncharacterized membrane protein YqjE